MEERPASGAPVPWLTAHAHLLPSSGSALDVACGRGRHALWLADHGLAVDAVDHDPVALSALDAGAHALGRQVRTSILDLEHAPVVFPQAGYDVIVVVHYLHRPLFAALIAALRPRGLLIYETFTRAQAKRGKPSNPAFLLDPGELPPLVAPLEILDYREGAFDDRDVASVVARRR